MGYKEDIKTYRDVNGYVCPAPTDPTKGRQCDNSTMFTSESAIIEQKLSISTEEDKNDWQRLINMSTVVSGLTVRYPKDTSTDAPDNLYAILAASEVLGRPEVAKSILDYGKRNFGFYTTDNPNHIKNAVGKVDWANFQWRQLQMLFAMYTASDTYKWYKFWLWPLNFYTFLCILTANSKPTPGQADPWRLSWLLIQSTMNKSTLCKLASKVWFKRLYVSYPNGMKGVAAIYYSPKPNNPFSEYWVD